MLNAPLPVVSMSWSRLLLAVFVLSFVVSSLLSLFFLDDFDDWGGEAHQPLYIAHSQLPQQQPHVKPAHAHHGHAGQHHTAAALLGGGGGGGGAAGLAGLGGPAPHERSADNASSSGVEAALGVSLSHLLFSGLEAEERAIAGMERRVREARAAQQKTQQPPTSPYAAQPLLLANLTQQHSAHLALVQRAPDGDAFSLVVVDTRGPVGLQRSTVEWYVRDARAFFLAAPPSLRHIVTDDWRSVAVCAIPGAVSHSAVTSDHAWLALAVTRLQPPFDYYLTLRVFHRERYIDVALPGHQPVTALTFLSHSAHSARLLVARRMDPRKFRAYDVRCVEDVGRSEAALTVEEGEEGPTASDAVSGGLGSGADVIAMLHYAETGDTDSVVLVEYHEDRANRQSPFAAALYGFLPSRERSQANDSGIGEDKQALAEGSGPPQLSNAVSVGPLTPEAESDREPEESADLTHRTPPQLPSSAALVLSLPPPSSPSSSSSSSSLPSPSSSWQLVAALPRYRSTGFPHATPPSALIASSSADQSYVTYSSTPFLTVVDRSRHFNPIEIIHLHPSTMFTHAAISDVGGLIALIDQQRDIILLQRAAHAQQPPPAPPQQQQQQQQQQLQQPQHHATHAHGHSYEAKSQWEVALELILPAMLKRLPVLSARIVAVRGEQPRRDAAATREDGKGQAADSAEAALAAPPSPSTAVAPAAERLYLCLLFEAGVLATFALDVSEHAAGGGVGGGGPDGSDVSATAGASDHSASDDGDRRPTATLVGMEAVGELIWLNWEFLIGRPSHPTRRRCTTAPSVRSPLTLSRAVSCPLGLAVIVFSAVFSLQMNTISRALQQTAAR